MKCDACGAPVENGKCTYCGKEFKQTERSENNNVQEQIPNNLQQENKNKSGNKSGNGSCATYLIKTLLLILFIVIAILLLLNH